MKTTGMLLNFKNDSCQILGRYKITKDNFWTL